MKRIRAREASEMLGITLRTVQGMALRGELPGAAKIGQTWTFDPEKLRRFVEEKEAECASQAFTRKAAAPNGFERPTRASNTEKAYQDMMAKLLGKSGTSASKRSRHKRPGNGRTTR